MRWILLMLLLGCATLAHAGECKTHVFAVGGTIKTCTVCCYDGICSTYCP